MITLLMGEMNGFPRTVQPGGHKQCKKKLMLKFIIPALFRNKTIRDCEIVARSASHSLSLSLEKPSYFFIFFLFKKLNYLDR